MRTHHSRRRSRRVALLGTSLLLAPLGLTGCDRQQVQAIASALARAGTGLSSPGIGPAGTMVGTGSMLGGMTGPAANPLQTIGPVTQNNAGGMPAVKDGTTQIPDFGASPTKAQIGQMLDAAAVKYGIPADTLKAVAFQESTWRPNATSYDGGHGKGIMQIDDRYHAFARTRDVWDPTKNIDYGANYLRSLYDQTGSWSAALKRYNGGSSYPGIIAGLERKKPWTVWT